MVLPKPEAGDGHISVNGFEAVFSEGLKTAYDC